MSLYELESQVAAVVLVHRSRLVDLIDQANHLVDLVDQASRLLLQGKCRYMTYVYVMYTYDGICKGQHTTLQSKYIILQPFI